MNVRATHLLSFLSGLSLLGCGVSIHQVGDAPSDETGDATGGDTDVPLDVDDSSSTGASGSGGSGDDGSTTGGVPIEALDVLFVIDNSGSMGTHQRAMVPAVVAMTERLQELDIDFRIGFTTTDDGNVWCGTTSPEAGQLVHSSCVDRLGAFTNQSGDTDVSQLACMDHCSFDTASLLADPSGPPWLGSDTQLAPERTLAEAVACFFPQGIDGCGFESQLHSGYKTLLRSEEPSDPAFGFIRPEANLLIVPLTDEADCSSRPEADTIFMTEGNKVFWHPDSGNSPTSAICWNAGTVCDGSAETLTCSAQSYDVDGTPLSPGADDDAVLYPPGFYVDKLEELRAQKQALNPNARVELAVVAGYALDGTLAFSEGNESFERDFGTGAGCSVVAPGAHTCQTDADCTGIGTATCGPQGLCLETATGLPPVRLEAVRASGSTPYRISICSTNWVSRFELIAEEMSQ